MPLRYEQVEFYTSRIEISHFCRHSGRYGFQCTSTTYYHNERDCILNLEDRVMRPSLFEPQIANFNATYIGMICDHATAILKLPSYLNNETCKAPQQSTAATTTPTPTTTTTTKAKAKSEIKKKKKKNDKVDSCFLELTDFVLEGAALAVESNVNPQVCTFGFQKEYVFKHLGLQMSLLGRREEVR